MANPKRIVHYINQFFAGIGGEDKANVPPQLRSGTVGPGEALNKAFGQEGQIVATVVCGDSYFAENIEAATEEIVEMVRSQQPDLFIAGPAFNAGRYGTACGAICKAVKERLNIPVVTAMYEENPGVEMYRQSVYILPAPTSARGMAEAVAKMAAFGKKLLQGEPIGPAEEEGYFPQGYRKNRLVEEIGATRAVKMLLKKLKGEPFTTEYVVPTFDRVPPAPPLDTVRGKTIALVTSGGIVPTDNPDRIESASATKWGKYSIEGKDRLDPKEFHSIHGGYDTTYACADPNRVVPLDVMRELEREGVIGKVFPYYCATVGTGTSVANAKRFGAEIAKELKDAGVDAVILTST